ncbi:hypothetical protein ACIGCM_14855 [Pseudomonas sp. NPDC078700]|uniref:hypothetical protein n=1 Tax=Pseudomonas sp. NPDC078700 TaxID=3364424 RepID=UPI0037C7EC41
MRNLMLMLASAIVLAGCMNEARHERACKIFSPATIETPAGNQDMRLDKQSTGDPTGTPEEETNC